MDWEAQISKAFTFTATYERAGARYMLLKDVQREPDGARFRDHLFVPFTARFKRLRLQHGDVLRLRGKVNRYYKKGPEQRDVPRFLADLIPDLEITNIRVLEKVG